MKHRYRIYPAFVALVASLGCQREAPVVPAPVAPPFVPSWTEQASDQPLTGFSYVRFGPDKTGWITGGSFQRPAGPVTNSVYVLLRTDNGGQTWTSIDLTGLRLTNGLRGVWPITDRILYANGRDIDALMPAPYQFVYKSVDGGLTWHKLPSINYGGGGLTFLSEQVGISTAGDEILKTTDGGTTWRNVWSGGQTGLGAVSFPTPTTGYASGGLMYDNINVGTLLKSTDQGETWQNLHWTHGIIMGMKFLTASVGFIKSYVVHGSGATYRGITTTLYKTVDGGSSWQVLSERSPKGAYAFLSEREFYCAGDSIWHTRDQGSTWELEYAIRPNALLDTFQSIDFSAPGSGYAVSREGLIVKKALP